MSSAIHSSKRADLAFSSLRPDRTLTFSEGSPLVKRLRKRVLGLGAPKLRSGSVPNGYGGNV